MRFPRLVRPGSPRLVVALLGACLLVLLTGAPAPAAADTVAILDDFERMDWPDPLLWPPTGLTGWAPSACQARRGNRALRAFAATPPDVAEPDCDAPVAAGAISSGLLLLDLRSASEANLLELHFDLWLRLSAGTSAAPAGLFLYVRTPDADAGAPQGTTKRIAIFGATGDAGRWVFPGRSLDLRNLIDLNDPGEVYDLRGKRWWLEWIALAPAGAPPGGGVFLDDVALVWEPDEVVPTPTRRPPPAPTATPTATHTPTVTATPTVTPVPTKEPTVAFPRIYLPITRHDPQPTPTATPERTETPEPVETNTPGPSPTATASRTPVPSATPTPVRRYLPQLDMFRSEEAYPGPSGVANAPTRSRRVLEWRRFAPP